MARGIYNEGLGGISGSINKQNMGLTYTRKGVIRSRVVPTNPQTASQQEVRNCFNFLSNGWSNTLNESERQAWEEARNDAFYYVPDRLNGTTRPANSAKSLYIAVNMNLLVANDSLTTPQIFNKTPGSQTSYDDITDVGAAFDASDGSMTVTYTGTFTEELGVVLASPPLSAGTLKKTAFASKMRVVDTQIGSSPVDLGSQYVEIFGAITDKAGQKVYTEVWGYHASTGLKRLIWAGFSIIAA